MCVVIIEVFYISPSTELFFDFIITLNIFYCSKRQKDKTQAEQLRQSSPITYITKYTIKHNNIS